MGRIDLLRENERLMHQLKIKTQALEKANAKLHNFAINDGLTGLNNRRHFQECLVAEIDLCERYEDYFALLFLDLDYFKIYNDINGHMEGDALLQTLAQLFLKAFRKTDTVARYGGDEFAVILPKTTMTQAVQLGEKVSRQVAVYPFDGIDGMPEKKITISVGCAAYPHDGTTADELLRWADDMLYKVKRRGRGRVA
jgi:diguanylate cyclase (GGDEF)-like protein